MKKLLLSIFCAFTIFALSAQIISEDFSTFTVGGKLAQQAQTQGKEYWTTWSNAPGGSEDAVIDEMPAGNKCGKFVGTAAQSIDQILRLGTKEGTVWQPRTTGKWELTFKIYIPTGKDGYFNIKSVFPSTVSETWAMQVYMGTDESPTQGQPGPATPGVGKIYGGSETGVSFNFAHNTWIPIKIFINLDDDVAEFYVNGTMVHTYQYSKGSFGLSDHRFIAAFNIFPPNYAATSLYYVDDVVFAQAGGPEILHQNNFDDKPNGAYVAQSYPDWWTTWDNKPGTAEDAKISNEQAQSPSNSAKCAWGTDLVFKAGDKTTGAYTIDFDMYIPTGGRAFFNVLHVFAGGGSEWAVGVYFNTTGNVTGTQIQQNGQLTPFTFPYATWFPVHMDIDLDNNEAKIKINNVSLLTWEFSLKESGGQGERKLAAVDFYPTQSGVNFYFDNFVYTKTGDVAFPIMDVNPKEITIQTSPNSTVNQIIKVDNSGTSMGDFTSWAEIDFTPTTGTTNYTSTYSSDELSGYVGYNNGPHIVEVAAKYPLSFYCDKVGTYVNKISYYMHENSVDGKLTARVYGGGTYNKPGEILFEKTQNTILEAWNDFTISTPILLGGQDIWVAFEFKQPVLVPQVSGHLMNYDDGVAVENSNWERLNGGSWSQLKEIGGSSIGCWMIKAFTQGNIVPGCWLSLSGDTYGNVPKGTSKTFNAKFNSTGLSAGNTYKANIYVKTNDNNNPLFTIPCKLIVGNGPNFVVDPTSLKATTFTETITKQIKITNIGNENGTYKAVVEGSAASWLTLAGNFDSSLASGGEKTFDAIFNPTGLTAGTYTASIKITTNSPFSPTITIPCELIIGKPVLSVDPTSIEKDIINLNTITQVIKISNSGIVEGTYNATVESTSGEWLTITGNTEGKVPVAGNATFSAVINPQGLENNTYNAKIKISTNDPDHQLFEILCTINVNLGIIENVIHTLVFPNPANDNVSVSSNYNINSIQIVNYMGQTVYSSEVNSIETNINTSSFTAGIYFIKINTEFGTQSVKLVVK